jgi:hypothetical protein
MNEDINNIGEQIEQLTRSSIRTTILEAANEPKGIYYLVGPDGKAQIQTAAPAWHNEKLDTPAELLRFAIDRSIDTIDKGAVYYNEDTIKFVYDFEDRRDVATCPLIKSAAYRWLEKPAGPMSQRDFIRLLRIQFRGCVPQDSGILNVVRNLKFNQNADAGANIQHGRESIGRSVAAQITGEASIPEELRLNIQVFENFPAIVTVMCAIETHPQEQQLQLTPYPLEVRKAMDATIELIAETLSDGVDKFYLYRGQPDAR